METWWTDPDRRLNTSSGSGTMGSGTSSIPSISPGPNPQVVYHNDALLRQLQQSSPASSASMTNNSQPSSKSTSGRELKSLTQQVQETTSSGTQSGSRKSGGNTNFAAAFQQQVAQQPSAQSSPPPQQNQANFQDAFMMQFQNAGLQQQKSQPRNKVSDRVLPYPTEDISTRYTFGKKLGEGAFGVVYEVRSKKTNKVYACKSISKTKLVRSQDRQDVIREIDIMDHSKGHPNIISFRNVFESNEAVQIVMELCEGGELFDLIVKRGYFLEAEAAKTMKVMLRLTAYLHSKCIVHRDIKPENFLLVSKLKEDQKFGRSSSKKKGPSSSSSEDSSEPAAASIFDRLDDELRITDFGLSARISRPDDTSLRQVVGTPFYVAPEVLRGDNYGTAVDVWSLGCIAYILLSGRPPFGGASTDEILAAVRKGTYDLKSKPWNGKLSESARDFVNKMLTFDPRQRPSCEEMLKHPWLTSKDSLRSSYSLKGSNMTDLKAFYQTNNFKKAALLACAHSLDTQQVKALEKVFRQIDSDNSGKVSVTELCDYLRKKNKSIDNSELMQLVEAFDCDQSGDLDYDEFLVAASKFHTLNKPENLIRVFKEFDMNHDGVLSLDEIQLALKRSGMDPSEAKKWMQEYDTDGSGSIDYYEFLAMMQKGNQQLEDACSHFKALTIF